MYCQKCGKEISDEAAFCPHCGAATINGSAANEQPAPKAAPAAPDAQPAQPAPREGSKNPASMILGILAACLGIVSGLIWTCVYGLADLAGNVPQTANTFIVFFVGVFGSVFSLIGGIFALKNKVAGLVLLCLGFVSQVVMLIVCFQIIPEDWSPVLYLFLNIGTIIDLILLSIAVVFAILGVIKNRSRTRE